MRAALRRIQSSIAGPKTKKKRHIGALKVLLTDTTLKLHFINQDKRSTDIDRCFFFISRLSKHSYRHPRLQRPGLTATKPPKRLGLPKFHFAVSPQPLSQF